MVFPADGTLTLHDARSTQAYIGPGLGYIGTTLDLYWPHFRALHITDGVFGIGSSTRISLHCIILA